VGEGEGKIEGGRVMGDRGRRGKVLAETDEKNDWVGKVGVWVKGRGGWGKGVGEIWKAD